MKNFRIARLENELSNYSSIVFYGIGKVARELYVALKERNINIKYCIVSELEKENMFFEERAVYSFFSMIDDIKKADTIIIIAVGEPYTSQIETQLIQCNIFNYLRVIDFMREEYSCTCNLKSSKECFTEIAEWKVDISGKNFDEVGILAKQLEGWSKEKYDLNKIVFLIFHMSPRVIKITRELKKCGYGIIALGNSDLELLDIYSHETLGLFDEYHMCDRVEEMVYWIIKSKAGVAHIFSNIFMSQRVHMLMQMKEIMPKIVFDQYDIANGMFKDIIEEKYLEAEIKCIENADGLCCRGFEIDYLIDTLKVDVKGKVFHFFDYCEEKRIFNKKNEGEKELSICYVGGISTEKEYPGVPYACMIELADLCENNKCHLHVYPVRMDIKRYQDYIELDKNNKYFHFHQPVASGHICKEISQYDYGIQPIKSGFLDAEDTGYVTKEEMIYAATNKYFVYLDAELPIIAEGMVKFDELFKQENVLLEWTIDKYDFQLLREKKQSFRSDVLAAKKKFQIENHINELIDFYNSL